MVAGRGATKLWQPLVGHALKSRFDRILDIGCGSGALLRWLWGDGFVHVAGVEPFLPSSSNEPFPIHRELPSEEAFDVVMFHHSLEHQHEPLTVLRQQTTGLASGGRVVVRLPVADSDAAAMYGRHWANLDPPRHLFVPTSAGMRALAERAGFSVVEEWQDPTAFGFWASELYRGGEPLHPHGVPRPLPPPGRFTETELARFEDLNQKAVASGRGDQAGFVLLRSA